VGVLAVVDGRVNRDGPHGGCVAVAIAVVVLAAVAARPHVDVAQSVATLRAKIQLSKGAQISIKTQRVTCAKLRVCALKLAAYRGLHHVFYTSLYAKTQINSNYAF
jgi:hypothetical protein